MRKDNNVEKGTNNIRYLNSNLSIKKEKKVESRSLCTIVDIKSHDEIRRKNLTKRILETAESF